MLELLKNARRASLEGARLSGEKKNLCLNKMAERLLEHKNEILSANAIDVEAARGSISDTMLDRLSLDEKRIEAMAEGIRQVALLPEPVGRETEKIIRPNGLTIRKVSVPMGVIGIIYESRPNVTGDAAALCLKSGNACVLRGGKEAIRTNIEIAAALKSGLNLCGVDENLISLITDTSRESASALMTAEGYIDLLIPRGGKGLIEACVKNATVPCIQTGTGICHIYVEKTADFIKALNILENAKTSRPSVCNAAEVLVVDNEIAPYFLPRVHSRLVEERIKSGLTPVKLILDSAAQEYIEGVPADESSFDTEFLDYTLAVKCVGGASEAIEHIRAHSTGHSDAIITESPSAADMFVQSIDSAAVYVNASTRFTDGGEFGLGCEMGISTQKLHARGPMGLKELTSYKYIIHGDGQCR